jgi:uncharacterized protein YjbI with pentapeptide repeats
MTETLEKYEVRSNFNNAVQFTAEITTTPDMLPSVKLGLAVKWGLANDANLSGADLSGANLNDANLRGADLSGADLSGADLRGANLSDAKLNGADLRGADLRGADLSGADLSGADLIGADLIGADLSGANLSDAKLNGADLRGADLRGADLSDANLIGANLNDANLSGANLSGANLNDANLRGADLSDANLSGANLNDANLRPIIADLWFILSQARREVPAMVTALRTGNVDGSTYTGTCACLVGTLKNAGAVDLPHAAQSPAERWFLSIRKGDKPGDASTGGLAAGKALEWIEQYCRLTGIALEPAA